MGRRPIVHRHRLRVPGCRRNSRADRGALPPSESPTMRRRITGIIVATALVLAWCGESGRWKDRGFESETECWQHHG